ncbi:MAG: hypothetical protein J5528_01670 [Firmicutes bacterium]|nr:hypothetical protein [Bacillota bacterium]
MKPKKDDHEFIDYASLIFGIAVLILAGSVVLAIMGHEKLYVNIMIGVGVLFIVGGFIVGIIPGAVTAGIVFVIIVVLIDLLPRIAAVLLFVLGIALIVAWFQEYFDFGSPK